MEISENQKSRMHKPEIPFKNEKSRTLNVEVLYPSGFFSFSRFHEQKSQIPPSLTPLGGLMRENETSLLQSHTRYRPYTIETRNFRKSTICTIIWLSSIFIFSKNTLASNATKHQIDRKTCRTPRCKRFA